MSKWINECGDFYNLEYCTRILGIHEQNRVHLFFTDCTTPCVIDFGDDESEYMNFMDSIREIVF